MNTTIKESCFGSDCGNYVNDETLNAYHGAQLSIQALGSNGKNTGKVVRLNNRKWRANYSVSGGSKIDDAVLSATNSEVIACPTTRWDSETHTTTSQPVGSYVIVVSDIHDMNLNRLNAVAKSFTIKLPRNLRIIEIERNSGDEVFRE